MKDESKAFKNLISKSVVETIGREILEVYPEFPYKKFIKVSKDLTERELKSRVLLITDELKKHLPASYPTAIKIITEVINRGHLKSFSLWPFSEYIGQCGLDHFDESMRAMYLLTQKFTAEWAIRPFLLKDQKRVLEYFKAWAEDDNLHVRRWVSEGTRPILPWGERIPSFIADPSPTLILLNKLKFDEELYVRKSVSNHLNDISKHNPKIVIQTLKEWEKDCPLIHQKKIEWIKRQALRTLIKKGHKDAMALIGVKSKANIKMGDLKLNQKKYKLNDKLEFQFKITSLSPKKQKIVVDYLIDFMKANGKKSTRTFKLKTFELNPYEEVLLKKAHSLKPITTMSYYKGLHHLIIQINGNALAISEWQFNP